MTVNNKVEIVSQNDKPPAPKKKTFSRYNRQRHARIAAIQAIFQQSLTQARMPAVQKDFFQHYFKESGVQIDPDRSLFLKITEAYADKDTDIQRLLEAMVKSDWSVDRLDPVLKALLQAAIAELLTPPHAAPAPVLISEYVYITKGFFQGTEAGYVNKVLDQLATQLGLELKKSE